MGWHGEKAAWHIAKMDELDALNQTSSPSQSYEKEIKRWICPDVRPFSQISFRLLLQYVTREVLSVCTSASRFIHASIRTSSLVESCAIAAIRSPREKTASISCGISMDDEDISVFCPISG